MTTETVAAAMVPSSTAWRSLLWFAPLTTLWILLMIYRWPAIPASGVPTTTHQLAAHGLIALGLWLGLEHTSLLVEQVGPPLPSGPLLIIAGALVKEAGRSVWPVTVVAWGAGMLGKVALYEVGSRYGGQAMHSLCRIAVTPNSSMEKANSHFDRWGAPLLVVAEFIPGIRTLAPSLAGAEKVRALPFLFYSALGAALWTAVYLGIGFVFRKQIDRVLTFIEQTGKIAAGLTVALVAAYLAIGWWRRRRSTKA